MKKELVLLEAQQSGKIVKVIYKLGSQPNHAREIIPLKVDNKWVYAKCLNSNSEKMFHIDKLKLLSEKKYDKCSKWDSNGIQTNDYEVYVQKKAKQNTLFRYIITAFAIIALLIIYILFKIRE